VNSPWRACVGVHVGALTLEVELASEGRPVALIGPNGSGKTTLLRTLAGALPARGHIEVGGRVWLDSETGLDLAPEARRVAYVPQGAGLFPHLSALDNVAFALASSTGPRLGRAARRRRALAQLDALGCAELAARAPSSLSGGERQRVALARATLGDPTLLLLDEPLAALDATARRTLRAHLATELERRALPAILVTHDLRDVLALDARIYVLDAGRILQSGSARALADAPINDFVAEFFAAMT